MRVITTAALAALLAVTMGWLPLSPAMGDHDTQDLKRQSNFEKAAQAMCGSQAAFADLGNGVIQCMLHTGKKAQKVAIK